MQKMNTTVLKSLIKKLPAYAEDIKYNLAEVFSNEESGLNMRQTYGIALAVGYFLGNEQILNHIRSEAKMYLDEVDANAAKSAVIITTMASTYYNFTHVVSDEEYKSMTSSFKMDSYLDPAISKTDYELYCFATSVLINCSYCLDHHISKLYSLGVSKSAINNVSKMVAVLRGAKKALEIESIRSYDFIVRGSIL